MVMWCLNCFLWCDELIENLNEISLFTQANFTMLTIIHESKNYHQSTYSLYIVWLLEFIFNNIMTLFMMMWSFPPVVLTSKQIQSADVGLFHVPDIQSSHSTHSTMQGFCMEGGFIIHILTFDETILDLQKRSCR